MQVGTILLWLVVILGACLACIQSALGATWVSARELENPPYIIEMTGEKALLYKSGDRAGAAVVIFREAYQAVLPVLLEMLEQADGIASKTEIRRSSFLDMFQQVASEISSAPVKDLWLHSWKADSARMTQAGFITEGFREMRVQSREFNHLPHRNASSVVSLHVLSATELFGIPGSIVIIYRHDKAREWGWHNLHDPFSFGYKVRVERQYTSREQQIIDAVAKVLGGDFQVIPLGSGPFPSYVDEWAQTKAWLSNPRGNR